MFKYFEINAEGHNIRCKMYFTEKGAADKAVIFCTGFAGHKDNNACAKLAEKTLSKHKDVCVTVFNWPAHGDDVKKKISLENCMDYLRLVIREVREGFGISRLYACATSFGGYLLLKYISENGSPFEKIALRCPAVSMYDVLTHTIIGSEELERIMKGKDVPVGFDRKILVTRSFLEELKENDIRKRDFLDFAENMLIIHGTADEVVPFEDSRKFADDQLIEFIPVEKADHRFQNPVLMSLAIKYMMEFYDFSSEK